MSPASGDVRDASAEGAWWWTGAAGILVGAFVVGVVAGLVGLVWDVDEVREEVVQFRNDTRTFIAAEFGVRRGWVERDPATCDLPLSSERVELTQSGEAAAACSEDNVGLVELAGDCVLWGRVVVNPSARTCVRFVHNGTSGEAGLKTCVWYEHARMWLRRCIGGVCERARDCGLDGGSRELPLCWDHVRGDSATGGAEARVSGTTSVLWSSLGAVCQKPWPDTKGMLSNGLERRLLLKSGAPSGNLLFGSDQLYSVGFGDAVRTPYAVPMYSVQAEPRTVVESGDTAVLDVVWNGQTKRAGAEFEVLSFVSRFGLVISAATTGNAHLRAVPSLFGAPFVCVPGLRVGARVYVGRAGVKVRGGSGFRWDSVGQQLEKVDASLGTDSVVCAAGINRGLVYP